ncbi:MAG: hypothetical protein JSU70_09790 [Phycisphaerales bacterium]|nr:MAG: hypothetical protein JSU70_09790 [Phycisphaerales bacterium]
MKAEQEIERSVAKHCATQKSCTRASSEMDKRVLSDALRVYREAPKSEPSLAGTNLRRIIMKSPLTKLAAAAVLVVAVALSFHFFAASTTTAYAIEQTIQASHSVRYLHVKSFMASIPNEPIECWVEFDLSGQIKNMRIIKPAWMDPADGETVIVWKDGEMEFWIKKKNFLFIQEDQEIAAQVLGMMEMLDPKHAAANIQQAQEEGDTQVEIDEPKNKAEPITITVTYQAEDGTPAQRAILFVDRATKLLDSIEAYQLRGGKYIHFSTAEFYDYDKPIDPKMFTLDDVPSDAMRVDQIAQEIGLPQGDLTDNEIAVEVVRQFFEALIAQDYAEAGRLFGGVPAERMQKRYGHIRFVRIVSLGEPVLNPATAELKVPYVVEIEENGVITKWKTKYSYVPVRQVHGQAGRWATTGAPLGI